MNSTRIVPTTCLALLTFLLTSAQAGEQTISPNQVLQIKQDIGSPPTQCLLSYNLPDSSSCHEVLLAELTLTISTDTSIHGGLILHVSPASATWQGSATVQVSQMYDHHADYKAIKPFESGTEVQVTVNVHEIVSAWYSGEIEDNGFLISILGADGSYLDFVRNADNSGDLRILCRD